MVARLHINRGTNRRYRAMVRRPGHRKWEFAGPERKKRDTAIQDLARAFKGHNVTMGWTCPWKRGVVLFMSDWSDPVPILRLSR